MQHYKYTMKKYLPILSVCVFFISCKFRERADFIFHHAKIYTVDDSFHMAEAMVIRDGKIVEIGTNDDILRRFESDSIINVGGKFIFPGLIDAHCHFTGFATDMWKCNLWGTQSFEEIIDKVKTYGETAPMNWIYGRGWDQNDWPVKSYPNKNILDSLFPDRPVFLKRVDGHAALVNQKALDLAGINAGTIVKGGVVELKAGKPTGILIDNAMDIVDNIIPHISDSLAAVYYQKTQLLCFEKGLTSVHDCGVSESTVALVDKEQKAGRLLMNIFALLSDSSSYYEKWINKGPYITDKLHVGGFKVYADGALGSRGACLIHDYADQPGWKGFILEEQSHFRKLAMLLKNSKMQMCTHAIGDSTNREILRLYAEVLQQKNDLRWRIEHAQVVDPSDIHFFHDYNIIPSVQPTHATSDMYWAGDRLGKDRVKNAYAYQTLLKTNGWMPLGTDFPVEDISPFKTFFAAVVRQDDKGFPAGGYQTENALTRQQALKGITIWAAKAAFEEKKRGSLEKGKQADFIITDMDLMACSPIEILKTTVLKTYIKGVLVYKK